jgi:hypothetical protein
LPVVAITDTSDLAPKTRIVASVNLPGVPEGTAGRVGRSVGLTLTRYRVAFDNDVDLVSVTHTNLVKEDEWDEFREQRDADAAAEAADEEASTAAEVEPKADDRAANSPTDDRLAALLAKSKAAKAAKAGGEPPSEPGPTPEPEAASSPDDDRLAALLAKSKAAKAKKQAEG